MSQNASVRISSIEVARQIAIFETSSRSQFHTALKNSIVDEIVSKHIENIDTSNVNVVQIVSAIAQKISSTYIITVSPCSCRRALILSSRGQMILSIRSTASCVAS